jgi:hypothetical protein
LCFFLINCSNTFDHVARNDKGGLSDREFNKREYGEKRSSIGVDGLWPDSRSVGGCQF